MALDNILKRRGRLSGRRGPNPTFEHAQIIGENYADSVFSMPENMSPYGKNADHGAPIGIVAKKRLGREALFPTLGPGGVKGLHTWQHSVGDQILTAHDKNLYLLAGDAGAIAKSSQGDWEEGTLTDVSAALSAGDIVLSGNFRDVVTVTADFDGTHENTVVASDKVNLADATTAVDQSNPAGSGGYHYFHSSSSRPGQTFKTGADVIFIYAISVDLSTTTSEGAVTLTLYSNTSRTTQLGSATKNITSSGLHVFAFAEPVPVMPGTTYFFELTTSTFGGRCHYTDNDVYGDGSAYVSAGPDYTPQAFGDNGDRDFKFITHVPATGIYTHPAIDVSSLSAPYGLRLNYNATTPVGTGVKMQTRVSSNNGDTWSAWATRANGDVFIAPDTDKTNMLVQWRAVMFSGVDGVTPSLDDVTVLCTNPSHGNWVSPVYDLGNTPSSNTLTFTMNAPENTSVTAYARGSSNGTVFGDWLEVLNSGNAIPLQRYVQVMFVLATTDITATPAVSDFVISYSSSHTKAHKLDISPLGRVSNLLTGNRVRFCNYEDWLIMADGLRPFVAYITTATQTTGTAQATARDSITLAADASDIDAFYNNAFMTITGGPYAGKSAFIRSYEGSARKATLDVPIFGSGYTFTRSSVAYLQDGTEVPIGAPRFENAKFGKGILIEEATANLLTANQSSVETDTTGLSSYSSATITRDTTEPWQGEACLKVVTPGSIAGEGMFADKTGLTLAVDEGYTASAYVKGSGIVRIYLAELRGGTPQTVSSANVELTSTWQRIHVPITIADATNTSLRIMVRTPTAQSITFYVDGLQIEKKAYATSWQIGGTPRSAEVLTIPTAGAFQKGNWTVEFTWEPTSLISPSTYKWLWGCVIDTSNRYDLYSDGNTGKIVLRVRSGGTSYYVNSPSVANILGEKYTVAIMGDGSILTLCVNGEGASTSYVEPIGDLPANMYVGPVDAVSQANGIYDDLRISNRARTLEEHQKYYQSGQPHVWDDATTWLSQFEDPADTTYSIGSALKVRNLGIDPPTVAPSGAADAAAGTPSGAYTLKVTYVNQDDVESNPSEASETVSVANKKIAWTIPVDSSTGHTTVKRRLYRTAAGASVYKFLAEIADNTTTAYLDNIADGSLGSLMADNNNIPPAACTLVHEHTSYVFYVDGYDIWYSKAGSPDQVPNIVGDQQYMVFPDEVLSISSNTIALMISGENFDCAITSNSGFIFDSDPTIDTTTMKVIEKNGGLSQEATCSLLSPRLGSTLVRNTKTGIRATRPGLQDNSVETEPESRDIQYYYERSINRDQAAAVFYNNYYIYSMEYQPDGGADSERVTFALDVRTEKWYGPWSFGMSCYAIVDNALYAGDAETGIVYRMFSGSSDAGNPIEMVLDLPVRSPAGEAGWCKFHRIMAIVSADSDTTDTRLKVKVDSREAAIALGKLTDTFPGDSRPGHNFLASKKHRIPLPQGRSISVRIEDDSSNPVEIEKVIVEYEVLNINR